MNAKLNKVTLQNRKIHYLLEEESVSGACNSRASDEKSYRECLRGKSIAKV